MIAKSKKVKIENSAEAWESGELGSDLKHARVVDKKIGAQIDEALGLQMISIRLEQDLIESLKLLGTKYDMGYQPLMREALKRFVEGEFKLIASEALEKQRTEKKRAAKRWQRLPNQASSSDKNASPLDRSSHLWAVSVALE